jgi:hypothetical protein
MKTKFVLTFLPLLATVAFVPTPATALAETPHYTSNGLNIGAEPVTTVGWGTITFKDNQFPGIGFTCRTAAAGTAADPGGGNPETDKIAGSGLTQVFASFNCESEGLCPTGTTPGPLWERLPWPNKLEIVAGAIRQKTTGIQVFIGCYKGGKVESGSKFVSSEATVCCKGLMPVSKHGNSALHPGFFEYAAGSGQLTADPNGEGFLVAPEGELNVLGYDEQQVINTKKDPA